eukprot:TRINITY_DN4367_c1_g1_i3.p7 TRINITY_DN4367_c1_g1~~TRINITY_DN4367_c1_g1_i3.p7  ORF type:complete len:177 (-),score=0.85 TRINITY_DN4367_c1_g1_i3:1525-2055(-)
MLLPWCQKVAMLTLLYACIVVNVHQTFFHIHFSQLEKKCCFANVHIQGPPGAQTNTFYIQGPGGALKRQGAQTQNYGKTQYTESVMCQITLNQSDERGSIYYRMNQDERYGLELYNNNRKLQNIGAKNQRHIIYRKHLPKKYKPKKQKEQYAKIQLLYQTKTHLCFLGCIFHISFY